ncbi:unnamed protein product, partial [Mesorhabditis spiculigera]
MLFSAWTGFMGSSTMRMDFLRIALCCSAVICCRCTPFQKAAVTRLVRNNVDGLVLSVGDGANDVAMIQKPILVWGSRALRAAKLPMPPILLSPSSTTWIDCCLYTEQRAFTGSRPSCSSRSIMNLIEVSLNMFYGFDNGKYPDNPVARRVDDGPLQPHLHLSANAMLHGAMLYYAYRILVALMGEVECSRVAVTVGARWVARGCIRLYRTLYPSIPPPCHPVVGKESGRFFSLPVFGPGDTVLDTFRQPMILLADVVGLEAGAGEWKNQNKPAKPSTIWSSRARLVHEIPQLAQPPGMSNGCGSPGFGSSFIYQASHPTAEPIITEEPVVAKPNDEHKPSPSSSVSTPAEIDGIGRRPGAFVPLFNMSIT